MELLFWLSFAVVFYVYAGYPALLILWRWLASQPVKKKYEEPAVSIVIAAHNERQTIERKLRNCLALDYPKSKMQIVVSLDGPTDGSESVVQKYVPLGIELIHSKTRHGKAAALNRALRRATGEIVVFVDARQVLHFRAIRELVANFADESVGAVSGELVLTPSGVLPESPPGKDVCQPEASSDVGLYWRYEKFIRSMESDVHSVPGATGAIYAIRRQLFEDLPEDTILDDVLTPLRIVLKGKRTVFEPRAKAFDAVACCSEAEYGRKVRTLSGNYQLLTYLPEALFPWRNPIFVQFVSHKVGRLLVPWALMSLFVANLFMLRGIYLAVFSLQAAWYAFAGAGHVLARRNEAGGSLNENESLIQNNPRRAA
jgi:cellulose synthase/poly-beta-1,6-N-acetylglucosamine synthase-like glycosyltransferase